VLYRADLTIGKGCSDEFPGAGGKYPSKIYLVSDHQIQLVMFWGMHQTQLSAPQYQCCLVTSPRLLLGIAVRASALWTFDAEFWLDLGEEKSLWSTEVGALACQ